MAEPKERPMSRLTKKLVLVVAMVAALAVAAAVALAAGSLTARNHSTAQPRLSEDTASIARHRALGRLGQMRMYDDPVVIARHRALGRLYVLGGTS
jgi:Ni/Co efflux regulator RcnB